MAKKKKTEEEFEEDPEAEDDVEQPEGPEEEQNYDPEELEDPEVKEPEQKTKKTKVKALPSSIQTLEEEIEDLKTLVQKKEAELLADSFMDTAPGRIEKLESGVKENRSYLLKIWNKIKDLDDKVKQIINQG